MRLGNVVDDKASSGGDGQGTGRTKSKRSSLDFKLSSYHQSNNGSPITTKPGKRKNRQQQQQYEEEQLMKQQQQQQTRRPHLSRARGHSGPPPRKWELADLQHMNEEELLQALYADPELAQEAARMAEKMAAEKGSSGPSSGRPSRRPTSAPRGGKRGSTAGRNGPSEYPDHMRELMDGGVPVIQWLIILVLLGAAFYQLRKILCLPDTSKDPFKRRSRGKGEGKNNGNAKKSKASSNLASLEKVALAIDADLHALDNVKSGTSKPTKKKANAAAAATKKQKGKKEKGNTKSNPTTTTTTTTASHKKQEDANEDDSVGSDDADFPGPVPAVKKAPPARVVPAKAPLPPVPTTMTHDNEDVGDGNGWQTVSKTTTRGVMESSGIPVEAKSVAPATTTASPPVPVVGTVLESKENTPPLTASLNGQNDPTSGKTKKKSKKDKGKSGAKKDNTNDPTNDPLAVSGVSALEEDDAALAQELQREEDNMAHHQTQTIQPKTLDSDNTNTWEEVATRKRKGSTTKADAATH